MASYVLMPSAFFRGIFNLRCSAGRFIFTQKRLIANETIYRPLDEDKKEIRILHLKASSAFNAILDCSLETVSLTSNPKPKYEAISYCWGEVSGYETIRLNDVLCDVPGSAAKVLRQVRSVKPKAFHHIHENSLYDRPLWIDAICINQTDPAERSSQVSVMGDVYSSCLRCLVWLGDADDSTASALEAIRKISDEYYDDHLESAERSGSSYTGLKSLSDSFQRARGQVHFTPLVQFLQKPWFTRAWILQEVALAPLATCLCGSLSIEWRDIQRAGTWTLRSLIASNPLSSSWNSGGSISGMLTALTINDISGYSISGSKSMKLGYLMTCSAYLNVSDPRDHLYALLGLVRWNPERKQYMQWLRVDYSLSVAAVARDTARAWIIQSGTLQTLACADGQYDLLQPLSPADADLSSWSWVPDTKHSLMTFNAHSSCATRALDFTLIQDSAQNKCILLKGFQICEVSRLFPGNDITMPMRLSQDAMTLGKMLYETNKDIVGSNIDGITLVRPFLEILTQYPESLNLSGLNDEECLSWFQAFIEYLSRLNETQSNSRGELSFNKFKLTENELVQIIALCRGRRFFLTACGKIGLGPATVKTGDCVAALFGGQFPCILRTYSPPENERPRLGLDIEPGCYRFVGRAFIPGVMNGEAVDEKEKQGEAPAIFELW